MEYRDKTVNNTLINLIIGLLVGASALWFLIVPGQTQRINQKANEKVAEYSDKVATQAAEINRMQEEMDASAESVNTANDQISQANARTTSYENLIGITTNHEGIDATLREVYYKQIVSAGGTPVLIPPVADNDVLLSTLDTLDAIVLSGGGDFNPLWAGEQPVPQLHNINNERDLPSAHRRPPLLG